MRELLKLPYDSSGYGDFALFYDGLNLKLQFAYNSERKERQIGELIFKWCTYIEMNGTLADYDEISYDTIYLYSSEKDENIYKIMLSGSDFQFSVKARTVEFADKVETGIFVDI